MLARNLLVGELIDALTSAGAGLVYTFTIPRYAIAYWCAYDRALDRVVPGESLLVATRDSALRDHVGAIGTPLWKVSLSRHLHVSGRRVGARNRGSAR